MINVGTYKTFQEHSTTPQLVFYSTQLYSTSPEVGGWGVGGGGLLCILTFNPEIDDVVFEIRVEDRGAVTAIHRLHCLKYKIRK